MPGSTPGGAEGSSVVRLLSPACSRCTLACSLEEACTRAKPVRVPSSTVKHGGMMTCVCFLVALLLVLPCRRG
jgi:hypothetical protein